MRTLRERIIHTALFEAMAITMATPAIAALTGASTTDSGVLSLLVSIGAVATNYVWTLVFDRLVPMRRRGFWLRVAHAAGLELGIASFTIPLTLWLTDVTLLGAVALDAAAMVFFMVYGFVYNLAFDAVMSRIEARRDAQVLSR